MTAGEAIAAVDLLRPNQYGTEQKLQWLQRLDGQILTEIEGTHWPERKGKDEAEGVFPGMPGAEPSEEATLRPYTEDTQLLAPFPYDTELYNAYLFCQIDLHNAEIGKYNQSLALLSAAWRQLSDYINRRRLPRGAGGFRL